MQQVRYAQTHLYFFNERRHLPAVVLRRAVAIGGTLA